MKNKIQILMVILGMVISGVALGQDFSDLTQQKMNDLSFMIGEWSGDSWVISKSGERETSHVSELISYELNETIIKLRGVGTAVRSGQEIVVHDALGVLYYETYQNAYKMDSWIARGMHTTANVELTGEGELKWWFTAGPTRTIRYSIKINAGKWKEIGEMSTDGESWKQFFEMNLTKK